MDKNVMLLRAQALCNKVYEAGEIDLLPLVFFEEVRQDLLDSYQEIFSREAYASYYARCDEFDKLKRKYHHIYLTQELLDEPWEFIADVVLHEIAHGRHWEMMASDAIRKSFPPEEWHNEIWESLYEDLQILFSEASS